MLINERTGTRMLAAVLAGLFTLTLAAADVELPKNKSTTSIGATRAKKDRNPFAAQLKKIDRAKEKLDKNRDQSKRKTLQDTLDNLRRDLEENLARKTRVIDRAVTRLEGDLERARDDEAKEKIQASIDALQREKARLTAWAAGQEPEPDPVPEAPAKAAGADKADAKPDESSNPKTGR